MEFFHLGPCLEFNFYFVQTKCPAFGLPLSSKKQVNWISSPFDASSSNTSSGAPGASVLRQVSVELKIIQGVQLLESIFSHSTVIEEELERSMVKSSP